MLNFPNLVVGRVLTALAALFSMAALFAVLAAASG